MAKTPNPFVPPKTDDDLVAWATSKLETASRLDEFTAKQNVSFMLGNQWVRWDEKQKRFAGERTQRGDPNAPVRVTVNKIGTHVERIIARLVRELPIPEARPASDAVADINAAKVSTRILTHELERMAWHQKLIELYFWTMPLGWSFWHIRWDPNLGPQVAEDDETGEPLNQGDVVIDEVPAFEMRVDPNATRWRDARWCIRTTSMTREAVWEQYDILPKTGGGDTTVSEWRLSDTPYTNAPGDRTSSSGSSGAEYIAVHQFWMRPGTRAKPEGLVFTWTGDQILEKPQPFPYAHGLLPFAPLNLLPAVGSSPNGRTWVTDLIPLQKDYNDARSREAMIRRTLVPKVIAATGQIDPNRITSRFEVINYNPTGSAPQFFMPDSRWASQFEIGMNRADVEIGDRSGQQDVSQGKAASSAAAATVIALQEADETKLAISSIELKAFIEDVGFQMLNLVKQFWTEERTIRTWSRDGKMEVDDFTGADVGERLDVHLSTESALPRSKSARVQMAVDLWSQGVISDAQQFVRMLDLPGTDFLLETLSMDKKQAEREHGYLLDGIPIEVKTWENHEAHFEAHQELRKSEQYEQADPAIQAVIDAHADTHFMIIAQKAAMGLGTLPGGFGMPPGSVNNILGENGQPINPQTGSPQDPNIVAGGMAPTAQTNNGGEPGQVPGIQPDVQQAHLGN